MGKAKIYYNTKITTQLDANHPHHAATKKNLCFTDFIHENAKHQHESWGDKIGLIIKS